MFPDLTPIVGQNTLHGAQVLFGEIFEIHGSVGDFGRIVFTKRDCDEFSRKKQYLSAKLLTYFSEHPLLLIGDSAQDPNIRAILSDINQCLPASSFTGGVISNIYVLEWRRDVGAGYAPTSEKLIAIEGDRSVRVRAIETDDFSWVFEAFGLIMIGTPSAHSADWPYSITEVAQKVASNEGTHWSVAQKLIDRIKREKGGDIEASDNRYHSRVKISKKSRAGTYSPALVDLLKLVESGGGHIPRAMQHPDDHDRVREWPVVNRVLAVERHPQSRRQSIPRRCGEREMPHWLERSLNRDDKARSDHL